MSAIIFNNTIGPVPISVVLREVHDSSLGITELPIETGAKITDHAYVEPKKLMLEFADANAVATYNALVRFQEQREPFTLVSGLFVYDSMLIRGLSAERDSKFSTVLNGKVELQEIVIVGTAYAAPSGDESQDAGKASGKAGGKNSSRSAKPTAQNTKGAAGDRASGTVMRGDSAAKTVPPAKNSSILKGLFN